MDCQNVTCFYSTEYSGEAGHLLAAPVPRWGPSARSRPASPDDSPEGGLLPLVGGTRFSILVSEEWEEESQTVALLVVGGLGLGAFHCILTN